VATDTNDVTAISGSETIGLSGRWALKEVMTWIVDTSLS
jgi:hypothetical protein